MRIGLAASALLGCMAVATATEAQTASPPDRGMVEATIIQGFEARLRDPDSARYTFGELRRASCRQGLFGRDGRAFGWAVEVTVNGKNGFGGYTGPQPYTVVIHDDGQMFLNEGFDFGARGHGSCRWEDQ